MKKKLDLKTEITNKVIEAIEAGVDNWQMPWIGGDTMGAMPMNARTGKMYRGINVLLLWLAGYPSQTFATLKQWNELGCKVKKGSKGTRIVFWKILEKKTKNPEGEEEKSSYAFLKHSTVFSAEQVEGAKAEAILNPPELEGLVDIVGNNGERIEKFEEFFKNLDIDIRYEQARAFFCNRGNYVNMPDIGLFVDVDDMNATEQFYSTLAHECVHATGHKSRLDRRKTVAKRYENHREAYAFEELIAELGAAFTCAYLGITPQFRNDHAKYIKSWLKVLKNDNNAIFKASSFADKALMWMVDRQPSIDVQNKEVA